MSPATSPYSPLSSAARSPARPCIYTPAIAASNGIVIGNGSANAKLGFSVEQDLAGDVKTLVYTGDLPSIQEMYYSIDGNIENIYYLTIGNYLRTQKLYYNGDGYITGMDETVEVR